MTDNTHVVLQLLLDGAVEEDRELEPHRNTSMNDGLRVCSIDLNAWTASAQSTSRVDSERPSDLRALDKTSAWRLEARHR